MRKIFAIAWKDAILRFTSISELLYFIVLPLLFTFLLAGGTSGGDQDTRVRLLVVNQARTDVSAALLQSLAESTVVRAEVLDLAQAEEAFSDRRASAMLLIPAGFDMFALQAGRAELELRLQPNSLDAMAAQRAVQVAARQSGSAVEIALHSLALAEQARPFEDAAARQAYQDAALKMAQERLQDAPSRLSVELAQVADQIEYDPAANSSAGQLITWVFIPLLGLSGLFAYERTQGTLRRLLTTPTHKGIFLLGAISGQVFTALVQMGLLISFGILVMHLPWGQNLPGLALLLLAFALASAALGVTLGAFVKTEGQASGLSMMLGMVMALLGGCWYPIELFPEFVRTAVKVLPTSWAMQGMLDLVLRGQGLAAVLPEVGVLLGFAIVFFVVGVWRFKYE